jgi:ABC-2 type transport system permease protein
MPDQVKRISALFPQTWMMEAIRKLQEGASFQSVGFTVPLLLAFGLLFVSVYAYRMKRARSMESFA